MEPIAIIGLDCVFPGAEDARAFWKLLVEGRDAVGVVPGQRWDAAAHYDPDPKAPAKIASRWGGFLAELDRFDPEFFGITPAEAERIDPQHKLLLEVSYHALESAGLPVRTLAGTPTGVFVGIGHGEHEFKLKRDIRTIDANLGVHTYRCFAANRLSYHLGLQGPSMAVDTACSSSLTAVHLACQSLCCGETELAIAAGVNVHLLPEESVSSTQMGLLSPDGRCRSFAADAAGHARSEGCGVVVLKRLCDALRDRNPIWGVIRGSALNHNGASNGIIAPNGAAQEQVVRRALASAGLAASDIGYLEAHATGTPLGERIELGALQEVWSGLAPDSPCLVGSVKTNLGHLEAAAGMAGLIKTLLALKRELIPRSLYGEHPHPDLPLGTQFRLVHENVPWPRRERTVRRAAVSAFGFGGANAHLIVEEAPRAARAEAAEPRSCELLLLSAKSEYSRQTLEARTAAALRGDEGYGLADLCFTLRTGRTPLPLRSAVVASGREQLAAALEAPEDERCIRGRAGRASRVALVSGPSRPASAALVASLRASWPQLSARALASAECHCARVADAPARERVLRECYLAELLLAWGIAPSWFLAHDAIAGWTGAYVKGRIGRGDPGVPLAPGLHDFKTGVHVEREQLAAASAAVPARLPVGLKYLALSGTAQEHAAAGAPALAPFAGEDGPWPALLGALGQLWVDGLNVDWSAFDAEQGRTHVPAPTYPFERRSSWFA